MGIYYNHVFHDGIPTCGYILRTMKGQILCFYNIFIIGYSCHVTKMTNGKQTTLSNTLFQEQTIVNLLRTEK